MGLRKRVGEPKPGGPKASVPSRHASESMRVERMVGRARTRFGGSEVGTGALERTHGARKQTNTHYGGKGAVSQTDEAC